MDFLQVPLSLILRIFSNIIWTLISYTPKFHIANLFLAHFLLNLFDKVLERETRASVFRLLLGMVVLPADLLDNVEGCGHHTFFYPILHYSPRVDKVVDPQNPQHNILKNSLPRVLSRRTKTQGAQVLHYLVGVFKLLYHLLINAGCDLVSYSIQKISGRTDIQEPTS